MRTLQTTTHRFATLSRALLLGALLALAGPLQANPSAEFSEGELEQILAPIALYPDTVLSHILIASTYPLEVVQAARWSRNNPNLKGEEALNAAENQGWDPSVTALTAFPQILERMDEDLSWTQDLGEAFLLDEARVIDTIQRLRHMAYDSGHLEQMEHLAIEREEQTIIIEPAVREVVYVPYYDTRVVYGHWYWTNYPPMYWYYPGGYYTTTYVYWGHGVRVSPHFYFSTVYWPQRHVVVVDRRHPRYRGSRQIVHYHDSHRWSHNPRHRRGVVYHHHELNRTYNVNRSYSHGQQSRDSNIRGSRRAQDVQISGGDRRRQQQHSGGTGSRDSNVRGDRRQSTGAGDSRARSQSGREGQTGTRRTLQQGDSGAESASPTNRREIRQQRQAQPEASSAQPAPSGRARTDSGSARSQSDSSGSSSATTRSSGSSSATSRGSNRASGSTSRSSSRASSGSSRSQGSSTRGSRRN